MFTVLPNFVGNDCWHTRKLERKKSRLRTERSMTDLTKVDPAVLESHATAGAPSASPGVEAHPKVVRPAAPPAYFPVSASCVLKTEDGKFPLVDQKTSVVLLCTDEKHVSVPLKSVDAIPVIRELVAAAPLPAEQPPTEEGAAPVAPVRPVVTVPLPSGAVIAINHWIEKKGVKGESTSKFAKPHCARRIAEDP